MEQSIPRRIEDNPSLQDGVYECVVKRIIHEQVAGIGQQVKILLWLPQELAQVVAVITLPHRFNSEAQQMMLAFCNAVGLSPGHLLKTPGKFEGRQLRVKTRRCLQDTSSGTIWFAKVVEFVPFGSEPQRNEELGMDMVSHSGLAD